MVPIVAAAIVPPPIIPINLRLLIGIKNSSLNHSNAISHYIIRFRTSQLFVEI